MKLAVISFSGNVGKSTIARHLLAPRIRGAQLINVESVNADEVRSTVIRGRQFAELQDFLQVTEHVIVDIGASNVEELLSQMHRYRGSHTDFDGYVLPTVPPRKQQQDTVATLAELARLGVPPERIRLVFNQVDDHLPLERVFETLLAYCSHSGAAQPILAARMRLNEIYALLRGTTQTLQELVADPTDYKAEILHADSAAERVTLARKLAIQRLAKGVVPELDACFAALDLDKLGLTSIDLQQHAA